MWPDYDEQTRTTEASEWALEQAYHYCLALWLRPVLDRAIGDLDDPTPPDLDFIVSPDAQELWDALVEEIVIPAVGYLWSEAYMRTLWALDIHPLLGLIADGAPQDRPRREDNPDYQRYLAEMEKLYGPDWQTEPVPWLDALPAPKSTELGKWENKVRWTDDVSEVPEEYLADVLAGKAADAERRRGYEAKLDEIRDMYREVQGLPPDAPVDIRNYNPRNLGEWQSWVKNVYATINKADPTYGHAPPPPFEEFPRTGWVQYGKPAQTPQNTLAESRTTRRWVEENWPAPTPPRQGQQRLGLDLVARLTALAWDTDPGQVKLAGLLAWDQVSNRRRLEMFLGSYDPPVGASIPSRVRDLLVGTTNKNSRRAIPVSEFKRELGVLGRQMTEIYGGRNVGTAHPRFHPDISWLDDSVPVEQRQKWVTEADAKYATVVPRYEPDFEPNLPRSSAEFFQRFRDVARESGIQAAGIINHAMLSAASTSGVDFDKVWCSHMDRRTRHTHFAADGQKASIDGKFLVGGAELEYPGDPTGPSQEIRNCRCRVGMAPPDAPLPKEQKRNTAQRNEIIHRQRMGIVRAREDPDGIGYVPPALLAESMTASLDEQENPVESYRTFTDSVIAFIGTPTSDGRMLARDIALSFRAFPLPLMWQKQGEDGHTSAYTVGVIEQAELRGDLVLASGYLLNTSEADEAADQLAHGVTRPSVDLAAASWIATDAEGNEVAEGSEADVYMTITEAELIGTTLVATPAFGDTALSLNAYRESRDVALVAAAAEEFRPRVYDHRLFENPNLTEPTLPTMGDDGRIYGHLACFGQCHRSIQSECVIAPRSRSDYAHFHTSPAVRLDDGRRLPVGRLTVGTGHAHPSVNGRVAAAHYDNTGTCFALVRVGEDAHGVWFSGVAAPWATPEQIEMGLSSPLSGDWRDFGQGLELVAALAVNTPGFSARGRSDEQGRPIALVASLGPVLSDAPAAEPVDLIKTVVREVLDEARAEDEQARVAAEGQALLERASQVAPLRSPSEEIASLLSGRR